MSALSGLLPAWISGCVGEAISVDEVLPPLWSVTFAGTGGPIQARDPTWVHIFGQLNLDSIGAVADPGTEDGDDDYGYRPQPATDVVISADVYWDPADGVGVELICPPGSVHESLYELAIYQDRLQLLRYDGGGNPSVYEILETSRPLGLEAGSYRLALRARHDGERWSFAGELRSGNGGDVLARIRGVRDATHGPSIGQGIGIYNVSEQVSRVRSIRVTGI